MLDHNRLQTEGPLIHMLVAHAELRVDTLTCVDRYMSVIRSLVIRRRLAIGDDPSVKLTPTTSGFMKNSAYP